MENVLPHRTAVLLIIFLFLFYSDGCFIHYILKNVYAMVIRLYKSRTKYSICIYGTTESGTGGHSNPALLYVFVKLKFLVTWVRWQVWRFVTNLWTVLSLQLVTTCFYYVMRYNDANLSKFVNLHVFRYCCYLVIYCEFVIWDLLRIWRVLRNRELLRIFVNRIDFITKESCLLSLQHPSIIIILPAPVFPSCRLADLFQIPFYPLIIFRWWIMWVVLARLTEGTLPNGRCCKDLWAYDYNVLSSDCAGKSENVLYWDPMLWYICKV